MPPFLPRFPFLSRWSSPLFSCLPPPPPPPCPSPPPFPPLFQERKQVQHERNTCSPLLLVRALRQPPRHNHGAVCRDWGKSLVFDLQPEAETPPHDAHGVRGIGRRRERGVYFSYGEGKTSPCAASWCDTVERPTQEGWKASRSGKAQRRAGSGGFGDRGGECGKGRLQRRTLHRGKIRPRCRSRRWRQSRRR